MTIPKKQMLAAYYYCAQGGVTSVMKQRMSALRADGWEVDFVFSEDMGAKQDLLNAGVRHVEISEESFFVEDIISMAGSGPYDCVVVFDVPELIRPLREVFQRSIIYEIHTPVLRNLNRNSAAVLLASDVVLVPSRWSKGWLVNKFSEVPDGKITVVLNIVDETIFKQDGPRKEGMERTLLWVGKLGEYKNWKEAVRIGLAFLRKHGEWRFLMVTGGGYTEKVVRDLLRYTSGEDISGRVSWIHNLPLAEMGVLYRSVASGGGMLLSSSLAESFCLVIHEAMRCGLPVVSTNVGAIRDIVVDSSTGLFYNTGDIQEALRKLDSLINDEPLRQGLVSNAFELLKEFSTERLCSEYLETLSRLVPSSSAQPTQSDEVERLYGMNDLDARRLANSISAAFSRSASGEEKAWIESIEALRDRLNLSSQEVIFVDYGAGSPEQNLTSEEMYQGRTTSSTLGKICRTASKAPPSCFLLFKLIREFQPVTCLELGTCLGVSTAYQAAALELNGRGQITTLEGAETLASIAKMNLNELGLERANVIVGRFQDKLPEVLRAQEHVDFAFIDGHHDQHATVAYFEQMLPFLTDNALLVFDDISWSEGMKEAWATIVSHERVKISVDLHSIGICIVSKVPRENSAMNITTRNGIEYIASSGFQDSVSRDTIKWDKEWMRYFSIHKDYNFYFYDMSTDDYDLSYSLRQIAKFGKKEMYFTKLVKNITSGIWVPGSEVVGKKVVEMGCGPGIFGRIAGRICDRYFGIDISQFALYIAQLTSPKNCQYVHLSDVSALREIAGTMDISVGRHFFIHHNYEDSLWILRILKDLIKKGGIISADFYYNPELIDGVRRRCAADPLNEDHPSSLFHFNYDDILRIAAGSQLEPIDIDLVPEIERQFATFKVP